MRISRNAKKARKAEAYALVVSMKTGRHEMNPDDIDSLLLYFAPALPKKAKTVEQWVAKAAANQKEHREYLRYLYVKEGVIMASDGQRAHRGKTTLADGYYCPHTLIPVDFDYRYPDFNRVYPDRKRLEEFEVTDLDRGAILDKRISRTTPYRRVPDAVAVREAHLVDALNGREDGVIYYDPHSPQTMTGDSDFGEWVLAGVRL